MLNYTFSYIGLLKFKYQTNYPEQNETERRLHNNLINKTVWG